MNTRKILLMFFSLILVFALIFSGCGPEAIEDSTGEPGSTDTEPATDSGLAAEGLEHLTDEAGENVTLITYDDEGREIINDVFVPIGENTTVPPNVSQDGNQSQAPTVTGQISDPASSLSAIKTIADAFNAGRFHLVSDMGDGTKTDLMIYDGNMRVDMPFEGSVMAMLVLGDEFYLLNPEKKTYMTLSKSLMSMFGMNLDDLNIADDLKDNFVKVFQTGGTPEVSTVSLDGQVVTLYAYKNTGGETVKIYLKDSSPVRIESFKADGSSSLNMSIESFNPNIKAEDINVLSSYTKKSLASFVGEMM